MRIPPVRPAPRPAAGVGEPLAGRGRAESGRGPAVTADHLLTSPLFRRMVAVMLVPAVVVGAVVLLLHLLGVI